MPVDANLLEQLLHGEEGSALDFKRDQYPFAGADDETKSELLKDILAFSNAWRGTTAYILIGVEEVKGGRSKVVGVNAALDDANLHQLVNSKTNRDIEFSYQTFLTGGVEIGIIEIPIQKRPFYLTRKFGKVDKDTVYKRDGSSTAVASPDEIARMGAEQGSDETPELILEWADLEKRVVLPSPFTVKTLFLAPQLPRDTFEVPRQSSLHLLDIHRDNRSYSPEIISYAHDMAFLRPFGLRLKNCSGTVGRHVRFVGWVQRKNEDCILDLSDQPIRPRRRSVDSLAESVIPLAEQLRGRHDPRVKELSDGWEVVVDFGDVRPQDEVWTDSALFIGSGGGNTTLEGELRGHNIPEPIRCLLEISIQVENRPMKKSDVEPYLDEV